MAYRSYVRDPQSTTSSAFYPPVTKADADLPDGICRALVCGTPGTVNLMEPDGNIRTNYPLQVGYNPLIVRQVRTGGTASDIWALY
jgi:hypothetical protein